MPPLKIESLTRIKSPSAKTGLLCVAAAAPGLCAKILLSIVPSRLNRMNSILPLINFVPPASEMAYLMSLPANFDTTWHVDAPSDKHLHELRAQI